MYCKTVACYSLLISTILTIYLLNCNNLVCFATDDSLESISFTSGVTLYSPLNKTYSSKSLILNLTAGVGIGINCTITFNIDNQYKGIVPWVPMFPDEMHVVNKVKANFSLPELDHGTHDLTIQVVCTLNGQSTTMSRYLFIPECTNITDYNATWTDTIQFTIHAEQEIPEFSTQNILILTFLTTTVILIYKKHPVISFLDESTHVFPNSKPE